jgi:hypothetical protein
MSLASLNFLFRADTENFERKLRQSKNSVNSFASGISKLGPMMAGAFSVGAIIDFTGKLIKMAGESDKAFTKVEQGVKQTGGAAGFTADELSKIASKLQSITTFEDDEILNKITAQLLSFPTIVGDNFTRAQKSVMDLATVLDGDLQSSAIQVGKALGDPVKGLQALRKSGVLFTEDQQKLIKRLAESNHLFEAQSLILDAIESQYGGQAEAVAKLPIGKLEQMKNAWGDIGETLGKFVSPAVVAVSESLSGLAKNIQRPYEERSWFGRFLADLDPVYNFQVLKKWIQGTGKLEEAVNNVDGGNLDVIPPKIEKTVESLASLQEKLKELKEEQENAPLISDESGVKAFGDYKEEIKALEERIAKYNKETETSVGLYGLLNKKIEENEKLIKAAGTEDVILKLRLENAELQKKKEWLDKIGEVDYKSPMSVVQKKVTFGKIETEVDEETVRNAEVFGWKLDAVAKAQKEISKSSVDWKGISNEFEQFTNQETMAIELTNTLAASIAGLGDSLAQGADTWAEYGKNVVDSLKSAIAMIIKEGVAIAVKNALIEYGATGPVALALAGLTGGLAAGIFSTAINQIPALAEGGLAYAPSLAVVGDNPNARVDPEVIAPLSKLEGIGRSIILKGTLKARGRDLVYVINQDVGFHNRTR